MIEVTRRVETVAPRELVAPYLSDFTTTAEWDPHTQSCKRVDDGPIRVGSEFDNVQRIGPMRSRFRYRVQAYEPGQRIVLGSTTSTLEATDSMRFAAVAGHTAVTYTARFRLKGLARLGEPVLRRMLNKVADDGAAGLQRTLDGLAPGAELPHPR